MEFVTFETVKKSALENSQGIRYSQYKATLKPKYGIVWTHIGIGYFFLLLTLLVAGYMQKVHPHYFLLTIPLGALITGLWIDYIFLFEHEAAHFNVAPDKKINDVLSNIFLGLIVGFDIKFYRVIHFNHHRYIGTSKDTENTYFNALNWKFLLKSLTGIRLIEVMLNRNNTVSEDITPELIKKNKMMVRASLAFNFLIVCTLFLTGFWQIALVWGIGLGGAFPFFHSIRQILEHRGEEAHEDINYYLVDQGETNRMFGSGLFPFVFGPAGFNRHLLHHWEPQISYTRLKEIEDFLKDTNLAPELRKAETSYFKTFFKLFNKK